MTSTENDCQGSKEASALNKGHYLVEMNKNDSASVTEVHPWLFSKKGPRVRSIVATVLVGPNLLQR